MFPELLKVTVGLEPPPTTVVVDPCVVVDVVVVVSCSAVSCFAVESLLSAEVCPPTSLVAPTAPASAVFCEGALSLLEAPVSSAQAVPGVVITAVPMPNATANAPTRPTCIA